MRTRVGLMIAGVVVAIAGLAQLGRSGVRTRIDSPVVAEPQAQEITVYRNPL